MKIFFVLVCVIALTLARPQDEEGGGDEPKEEGGGEEPKEEGGGEEPKEEGGDEPKEEGGDEPKGDEEPKEEGGDEEPKEENLNGEGEGGYDDDNADFVNHDDDPENEDQYGEESNKEGLNLNADMTPPLLAESVVTMKIPDDEQPPKNAVTNNYGEAMKTEDVIEYNLGSHSVKIFTEKWVTQFMRPATKPNCLCQTRGPLPQFKLIGNIHFRHVKKPPKHRFLTSTDASVTECPPCNCADCFTTQTVTRRHDKVC